MERSAEFTAVSEGRVWGGGHGAAWLAWGQPEPTAWISIDGHGSDLVSDRGRGIVVKARAAHLPASSPGPDVFASSLPRQFVGGVLTVALYPSGITSLLPGVWLLLYGTAVD
jgi:hypothetical protein